MIPSQFIILVVALSLNEVQIHGDVIKVPRQINTNNKNDLNDFTSQLKNTLQSIKSNEAETILDEDKSDDFDDINDDIEPPISDIDIDNLNNALIIKFSKNFINFREALFNNNNNNNNNNDNKLTESNNFSRYTRAGRTTSNSLMRFGKRQIESSKDQHAIDSGEGSSRYGRSSSNSRDSRGDNFMRFGRTNNNFMRFGRAAAASSNNNMMRFGRSNANNLMRFGRSSNPNLMRFGRSDGNLMRFGRSNLMRFGRSSNPNLMRFGRSNSMSFGRTGSTPPSRMDNFIRFGRSSSQGNNLMRFGRPDRNFMRFGKLDQNFMRFGKRGEIFYGSHLDSDLNNNNNNKTNDHDLVTIHNDSELYNSSDDQLDDTANETYDILNGGDNDRIETTKDF